MNQVIVEQKICCCVIIVLYAFERNKYTQTYVFVQVQLPGGQIWQLCIHIALLRIHLCWEDGDYFNGA